MMLNIWILLALIFKSPVLPLIVTFFAIFVKGLPDELTYILDVSNTGNASINISSESTLQLRILSRILIFIQLYRCLSEIPLNVAHVAVLPHLTLPHFIIPSIISVSCLKIFPFTDTFLAQETSIARPKTLWKMLFLLFHKRYNPVPDILCYAPPVKDNHIPRHSCEDLGIYKPHSAFLVLFS